MSQTPLRKNVIANAFNDFDAFMVFPPFCYVL
jgi:hypothetical protein